MAYISNEIINEIRNKTDIVEVVSRYVNLTKTGKNYIGVCPFHDDHSPSMSVSPEKQIDVYKRQFLMFLVLLY